MVKNIRENKFNDNKLTNVDSISVKRNTMLNEEISNKKNVDHELDKNKKLRFNQTLEKNLKVSVGNDTYNLNKYDKLQITDTTIIKTPNFGGNLLQNWVKKCND